MAALGAAGEVVRGWGKKAALGFAGVWGGLGDGVVAAGVEGVAAEEAAGGEGEAAGEAVASEGFLGVPGAGGVEAALPAEEGGERPLIDADDNDEGPDPG